MYLKTLFLLFGITICGLTRFAQAKPEPFKSPLRGRIDHQVLKRMISLHDQEVFEALQDKTIDGNKVTMENFDQINFSLRPADGIEVEDFDFDVSISKEYFGCESDKIVCDGKATLKDGSEVEFTVPIDLVKIQYELTKKFNHEYNFDANQFVEKEWSFNIGEKLTMTKGEISEEGIAEVRNKI